MAHKLSVAVIIAVVGFVAAVPSNHPTYIVPAEHRSEVRPLKAYEALPYDQYDYSIVPADEYRVSEYVNPGDSSVWDYGLISKSIGSLGSIGSKVAAVGKILIVNGGLVLLGVLLVVGFCAFTKHCSLVLEKPFARQLRSHIPYLDEMEDLFRRAYDKYHEL
ncbi:uncharacterized protein LOC114363567 [Ostrinia furnacalis]|uniref:uncharacterized protein LOC114363567 n=1 Tax=Ostrinia furnacalis TaxID=93504 RepID=UPI00103A40AF|nr:uncharacterized protein LOC114363567 [Ostrinia furnacalis]